MTAHGVNPSLAVIDPEWSTKWAFVEAVSNVVAAGGDPDTIVVANNYIGPTPTKRVLGGLNRQVDAVGECVQAYEAPVISGKDSNSSSRVGADGVVVESPAVVGITAVGTMEDVDKAMTTDIKQPGSVLVLVGKMDYAGMGGSTFYNTAGGSSARVPRVDLGQAPQVNKGLYDAIQAGKVLACHDVSEGGMITSVAEMCFGGGCGATLTLPEDVSAQNALFNETAGCYVVEVADQATASELFGDLPYREIGHTTTQQSITARRGDQVVLNHDVVKLKQIWQRPMETAV